MKKIALLVLFAACAVAQIVGPQPIPAGLPPTGPCGGDLSGTEPNCTVVSIGGKAVSLGGALTISGAFGTTFTVTGTTSVTLPTSGTLATTTDTNFVKGAANLTTTGALPFQNGTTGTVTQATALTYVPASTGLTIGAGAASGTNAYSLNVTAPTGATNNIAAIFTGAVANSDNLQQLQIVGNATQAVLGLISANGQVASIRNNNSSVIIRMAGNGDLLTCTGSSAVCSATNFTATGTVSGALYVTASNCASSASPAVCAAAPVGRAVIAAAATTVVVNTTAVTANSEITITEDASLGTALSVTCNTQSSLIVGSPRVTARSAGVSFTVGVDVAPTANPLCFNYKIAN